MTNRHTIFMHGDYLDGDLSPDEMARVEEHLRQCDPCREDFERLKRLKATLRNIEAPDPGDDYFDNLLENITARAEILRNNAPAEPAPRRSDSETKRILRILIRLAAAVTLLFTAFYISDFSQRENSTGWTNRVTQSDYVDSESKPVDPADYLPAGITTGVPYSTDTNQVIVEEPSDTGGREDF